MTRTAQNTRTWPSIDAVKQANTARGHHWFDPDTMRFFDSRVESGIIGARTFVSSEQFHASDGTSFPRIYKVREVQDDGSIDTLPVDYATREAAVAAAERVAE